MTELWIETVDITCLKVDGIVYITNTGLTLSGGTGGAIYRRGGMQVQDECDRLGKRKHGDVVATKAGLLPSAYILHAVGMGYSHPDVEGLLKTLTTKCLEEATRLEMASLAFPAFTCGRMKNPPDLICRSMGGALAQYDFSGSSLASIGFALNNREFLDVFQEQIPQIAGENPTLSMTTTGPIVVKMPWKTW